MSDRYHQHDIRLRLTLYWAAVLAIIMAISASAVFVIFTRQQWAALDAALLEESDTSAAAIAHADEPTAAMMVRRLSEERDIGPGRRVRLIIGDRVVADFGSRHADLPITQGRNGSSTAAQKCTGTQSCRCRSAIKKPFWKTASTRAKPETQPRGCATILLIVTPMLLFVCVVGGYWLAGRALAPIVALSTSLAAMGQPTCGWLRIGASAFRTKSRACPARLTRCWSGSKPRR